MEKFSWTLLVRMRFLSLLFLSSTNLSAKNTRAPQHCLKEKNYLPTVTVEQAGILKGSAATMDRQRNNQSQIMRPLTTMMKKLNKGRKRRDEVHHSTAVTENQQRPKTCKAFLLALVITHGSKTHSQTWSLSRSRNIRLLKERDREKSLESRNLKRR